MILAAAASTGSSAAITGAAAFEVVSTLVGGKVLYDQYGTLKAEYQHRQDVGNQIKAQRIMPVSQRLIKQLQSSKDVKKKRVARKASQPKVRVRTPQPPHMGRYMPDRGVGNDKWRDTILNPVMDNVITAVPSDPLTVPRGDSAVNRLGRKYILKSIHLKGNINWAPGTGTVYANEIFRMWIILDTQCNGVQATATDVFGSTNPINAFHDLDNTGRFRTLKKVEIALPTLTGGPGAWQGQLMPVDYFMPCSIPITYDQADVTGAVGLRQDNNVIIFVARNFQNLAANGSMGSDLSCRIRFEDMP